MRSLKPARWAASAVVAGTAGLVQSGTALAQDQGDIDEVQVVSKRLEESLPEQLAKSGSRVTVITSEDIKKGGYNDLGTALQSSVPGLYLNMIGGQFSYADVSLNGGRPGDVLWLVDGVRVNNRLYASTLPLDTLPAHMIERIEVLEGGQGLFYGTQAISGVINVVTKEFTDTTNGEVAVGYDTEEGKHASAYIRGALAGNHLVLYGSIDDGKGYQPFRDQDYQASATDRNRGYDVKTGGIKFMRDFTDNVRLSATYQHTDADIQLLYPMWVNKNVNSRDEELVSAKLDWKVSDSVDFYVKGYYHDWDTHYTTLFNSLTTPGAIEVDSDNLFWGFNDKGANALLRLKLNQGYEYYVGYDVQQYSGRDEVLLIADHEEKTQAVFGQVRTDDDWSKTLHLSAGLRYNKPSEAESSTTWTATAKYNINDNLFVTGLVGTNFKLPTAEELYAIDPFELGDPDLKPESSRNVNVSIGGALAAGRNAVHWELIGFAANVTDLISTTTNDDGVDVFLNVPGKVKVRGGTFLVEAPLSDAFTARASFTRSSTEDPNGVQIGRIPTSTAQAGLDYRNPDGRFGTSATARYVGDVVSNAIEYGRYGVFDLSTYFFVDQAKHHRISLFLYNAFDKEYGRPSTGFRDADDSPYPVINVGQPRMLLGRYTFSF
ncbi:MAG: TonB-dependent receptor [Gammaproteobacteria bacterium]